MGKLRLSLILVAALSGEPAFGAEKGSAITFSRHDDARRVDVLVDGKPFTSYRWTADLAKPVLYPIYGEAGAFLTRGWPLEPRADEATDHPHHVGFWLNYGDVDGVDFWGNSKPQEAASKKGQVIQRAVRTASGGRGHGALTTASDWVMPDQRVVVHEETAYGFAASPGRRAIDRVATLSAPHAPVKLPDTKEGMLGLRLARSLEHPGSKNPTGTGHYRSSEGLEGEAVWGTRARWVMLTGATEGAAGAGGNKVTLALLDHPRNFGHPTYWHARPWGLFAANPLGQKVFSKGKTTANFALPKGGSARFAYRLVILSKQATPAEIEAEYQRFVREVP